MGVRLGGRAKGTPNKRTQQVEEIIARTGVDPIEAMIQVALGNVPCGTCHGKGKTKYQPARGEEKLLERTCESCYGSGKDKVTPELRGKMWAEVAQYHRPKRKAIEHTVEAGEGLASILRERFRKRTDANS